MLFDVADALSIPPSVIQEQLAEIQWADHINAGAIAQILGQGLGNFVEFLTNLFLVLLYLVYLLFERESFIRRLENSFSHRSGASRAVGVIHSINQQIASLFEHQDRNFSTYRNCGCWISPSFRS